MSVLYTVATPIGNLGDITFRAVEVLKNVDFIACEDTRTSKILCDKYGIITPLISYHKYSEKERVGLFLNYLNDGKDLALITDAGTPLISDPGGILVEAVKNSGFEIVPIPGACAVAALLSAVQRQGEDFKFIGFLPKSETQIKEIIKENLSENLIFYESPKRLLTTLKTLSKICPDSKIAAGRELTKKFEETTVMTIEETAKHYSAKEVKGEFVLMLLKSVNLTDENKIKKQISTLLKLNFSNKDIVNILSSLYGYRKNEIYEISLSCMDFDM